MDARRRLGHFAGRGAARFSAAAVTLVLVCSTAVVAAAGVDAGPAAARVAGASVPSSPVASYVQRVYQDLLGRAPDPAGLGYWSALLSSGTPRPAVAWALVTSDEYRGDVIGAMYRQFLGRATDAGGLDYWVGRVDSGMTFEQFQSLLLGSDEYFDAAVEGCGRPDALRGRDVPGRARPACRRRRPELLRR